MPRSQGSITYIEHRSPMKDETGKYHAQKVLNGYCEGESPRMTKERVGNAFVYRLLSLSLLLPFFDDMVSECALLGDLMYFLVKTYTFLE